MKLVPPLLSIVLSACSSSRNCSPVERYAEYVHLTESELEPYLADGVLTVEECESICLRNACEVEELHGCEPVYGETGETGEPHDAGNMPYPRVLCDVTAGEWAKDGRGHAEVLSSDVGRGPTLVAARLAATAAAEATSVRAFLSLGRELRELGAPAGLVEGCHRAAAEEVVHARLFGRLARARGGVPDHAQFAGPGVRDALAIAVENVVEGCIGEAWAAMVAAWQADRAGTSELREAYARIAIEEAGHTALAGEIAAWFESVLGPEERAAVTRASAQALDRLHERLSDPEPALAELGLPSREEAEELLGMLREALASGAA